MKTIHFFLLMVTFSSSGASSPGLSEWSHETRNGTYLNNNYGLNQIIWDNQKIEGVTSWYYYKNHIIGKTGQVNQPNKYFILDEIQKTLFETKESEIWKNEIKLKNLNPFYKRWFESHSSKILIPILLALNYWYISTPLALILLLLLYKSIQNSVNSKFNMKNPSVIFLLLFFSINLTILLLELNYNSI